MAIQSNFPSVRPSLLLDFASTKQLDSRITYTRASTASYYDGVTTSKAEENLLTYSQEFDNAAWNKSVATVTANSIAAPDGTTTADTLTSASTGLNAVFRLYSTSLTTGSVTASIYAKAGTKTVLQFGANASLTGSLDARANFDISAGALGTVDATLTASIVSVGSGWYRCVVSWTRSGTASANGVWSMQDSTTAAREATSTAGDLYLWGAQLEQRSAVSAYTATTTQAITNYIPVLQTAASGVARFDNNPTTGESLGLLIEESRTNLVNYSAEFDNAYWTKANATLSANVVVSPDGTLSGDKIVENTSTSSHAVQRTTGLTITSGASYTASVYAKAAERTQIQLQYFDGTTNKFPVFSLIDGTKVVDNGIGTAWSSTNVGNGWWRFTITVTSASTSAQVYIYPALSNANSYTGDGYSGIFIWGAQLEAGAFATSYIPTVASQVTRAADAASMTGTNFSTWFNQGEGTIYSDFIGTGSFFPIATADATLSGTHTLYFYSPSFYTVQSYRTGSLQANVASSVSAGSAVKISAAYAFNNFAASFNGGAATADTSYSQPNADRLRIGTLPDGTAVGSGTIKKIAYYPVRIQNSQLQALTS